MKITRPSSFSPTQGRLVRETAPVEPYVSSLLAHSVTRGQRILIKVAEDLGLGVKNVDQTVGIVQGTSITGQRMRIFLWNGGMIYCGINDRAAIVL